MTSLNFTDNVFLRIPCVATQAARDVDIVVRLVFSMLRLHYGHETPQVKLAANTRMDDMRAHAQAVIYCTPVYLLRIS